jgi:hypothetical protein
MKRNFKTLMALAVLAAFPLITFAQTEKSGYNLNKKYAPGAPASNTANNQFDVAFRNDVPIRALRNFINNYRDVTSLHWYNIEGGFFAQFFADSIDTRAEFDANGFWCETISNFTEEQTPKAIRDLVKEVYADFNIIIVHKIETNAALWYVVKLENGTQWKTLKIKDGEMELTGDYVKG